IVFRIVAKAVGLIIPDLEAAHRAKGLRERSGNAAVRTVRDADRPRPRNAFHLRGEAVHEHHQRLDVAGSEAAKHFGYGLMVWQVDRLGPPRRILPGETG